MAGFAFAALFYLITAGPPDGEEDKARYNLAAQALSVAFLALLLSCINWAILAGESVTGGRAATIEVFAGAGFALAAVQLFYSILLLIRVKQKVDEPLHKFFQTIGGALLCPFVFLVTLLGVTDYEEVASGPWGEIVLAFGGLLWFALGLCVALLLPNSRWKSTRLARAAASQRDSAESLPVWLNPSYVTVAVGALALVGTAILGAFVDQCTAGNPALIFVALILTFTALLNQAVRFFHPPDEF